MAKSRAPLIAMIAAGLSLVVATIAVLVVVTRKPPAPPAPTGPTIEDGELAAADVIAGKLELQPDDRIVAINGMPVAEGKTDAVVRVLALRFSSVNKLYIEVDRHGASVLLRRAITGDLHAAYLEDHPPGPPMPSPTVADADLDPDLIDSSIHKVDDTTYEIDRALIDQVLASPMTIAKGARVVPAIKNGQADGYKLYAIRPNSVYAKIGLNNGDTVQAINGLALTSPDKALELYTKIKDAHALDVDITRRGKPLTLHYTIK